MLGQIISHYKILDKLGEGGMGVVYKAHDTKLDRTVALKFLPSQLGTDAFEKQRFINEAKAASALDHSNICAIHSIDESDDGNLFIVMAYYEGMSLKEKIEHGPLPLKDAVQYSIQIASGLQKAHEKGIVHRDLKPANIFITNDNQVKIIDFGLAKAAQRTMLTKSGTTLGTVPYMSPEQAQGSKVDHRTDIWSLGVVMYEMVTGQLPFKSEYDTALVYSIVNEDPEPVTGVRSGVPMALENIINKCLEKEPQDRYQHTDEIIVDLRKMDKDITTGRQSTLRSTESPLSSDKKVDRPLKRNIKMRRYGIPLVALLLIVLYVIISNRFAEPEVDSSIAVLPLENLSSDPDDAYFTDGIHEDIIIQLAGIDDLRVIGRGSVIGYSPGERDYRRIRDELGVATLLEGSVRRAGNRVRVSVNLIDAETNEALWAESYDRELTDLFDIQSDIAQEITAALHLSLTAREREAIESIPTHSKRAYDFYLQGRQYYNRPGFLEENFQMAQQLFERAIDSDPEFTQAYAALSITHSAMYWHAHDQTSERLEQAESALERALSLDPGHPEVLFVKGIYYYWGFRDYDRALEEFRRARESLPNYAEIYHYTGAVQRRIGLWDEALQNFKKAADLDPRNAIIHYGVAGVYFWTRQYEEAITWLQSALSLSPDFRAAEFWKSLAKMHIHGTPDNLQEYLNRRPDLIIEDPINWWRINYISRDYQEILHNKQEFDGELFEEQWETFPGALLIGLTYDALGEEDKAFIHYNTARDLLVPLVSDRGDDHRLRSALGRTYAGLGMHQEAIREGKKGVELLPLSKDTFFGPQPMYDLAIIYAKIGDTDNAIEMIEKLLEIPNHVVSRNFLRLDPGLDRIRNDPRFQQLIDGG